MRGQIFSKLRSKSQDIYQFKNVHKIVVNLLHLIIVPYSIAGKLGRRNIWQQIKNQAYK